MSNVNKTPQDSGEGQRRNSNKTPQDSGEDQLRRAREPQALTRAHAGETPVQKRGPKCELEQVPEQMPEQQIPVQDQKQGPKQELRQVPERMPEHMGHNPPTVTKTKTSLTRRSRLRGTSRSDIARTPKLVANRDNERWTDKAGDLRRQHTTTRIFRVGCVGKFYTK